MKIIITRNTSIAGKSVKGDPEKVYDTDKNKIGLDESTAWQLIGANKARRHVEPPEQSDEDELLAEMSAMEESYKKAVKEMGEAHAAEIKSLNESAEAALAAKDVEITKLQAELKAVSK